MLLIAEEDPAAHDVRSLLHEHLEFCRSVTPPEHVHALGVSGLIDPLLTVFGARQDGKLLGIAALKHLDASHAEVKSMHTREDARGQGVGSALVDRLLAVASARGYRRLSLETGAMDAFAPARSLYARAGFVACEPFGDYTANRYSTCMTLVITP